MPPETETHTTPEVVTQTVTVEPPEPVTPVAEPEVEAVEEAVDDVEVRLSRLEKEIEELRKPQTVSNPETPKREKKKLLGGLIVY